MALIPDVVTLTTIESQWGNRVRDQGVAIFASTAERQAGVAIPTDGRMCYVANIDQLYVGTQGIWRAVAHDQCPEPMQLGSIQIAGRNQVSGDEGGEIRFLQPPNFGSHLWIMDAYRDSLRFFAQGKGTPLALTFDTVHNGGKAVFYAGFEMVGGNKAKVLLPDNTNFEVASTTMGNMLTVKSTGTPTEGVRANINMQVPTLTTGNLVTITSSGQIGRTSRGIDSLDSFEERIAALEARIVTLESRLAALEPA